MAKGFAVGNSPLPLVGAFVLLVGCIGPATPGATPSRSEPAISPSPATPSPWATYRHERHGFSFEYPIAFDQEGYSQCALQVVERLEGGTELYFPQAGMALFVFSLQDLTAEALIDRTVRNLHSSEVVTVTRESIVIGGTQAIRIKYVQQDVETHIAALDHDGYQYRFWFADLKAHSCDVTEAGITARDAYDHMLATFRFDR